MLVAGTSRAGTIRGQILSEVLAEITEIFDREEMRTYLDGVQRVGPLGHTASDEAYEEMWEAGASDEDPVVKEVPLG